MYTQLNDLNLEDDTPDMQDQGLGQCYGKWLGISHSLEEDFKDNIKCILLASTLFIFSAVTLFLHKQHYGSEDFKT